MILKSWALSRVSINIWYSFERLNPDRPAADLKEAYNMSLVGDEKVICFVFTFDIRGSVRVACRNLCVRISAETYNYNAKHLITGVSNCYGVKHNLINQLCAYICIMVCDDAFYPTFDKLIYSRNSVVLTSSLYWYIWTYIYSDCRVCQWTSCQTSLMFSRNCLFMLMNWETGFSIWCRSDWTS